MDKKGLADALQGFLSNTYALYLKTQNYHWNVNGQGFYYLHAMFEEQYKMLAEAVDEIAEQIRQLGVKVPASFKIFAAASKISDGNESNNAESMLADLLNDHKFLSQEAYRIIDLMSDDLDEGVNDMLVARLREHDKVAWMLESSL